MLINGLEIVASDDMKEVTFHVGTITVMYVDNDGELYEECADGRRAVLVVGQ